MSDQQAAFDRLHPAVQHHIVNSLGWNGLRPTQQAAVGPILEGQHCILLAPTAGGKTEAAIFPVLSRMLSGDWRGLSVLYVCPIRALLNNLEPRLSYYFGLIGRRVGVWHGDIGEPIKKRTVKDPPDLLLTTPESLEGMLISANDDKRNLLVDVGLIIVDELHAFCGDDRGWHVRCLIQRLQRLGGRRIQVLGLTATVGNPKSLIDWMLPGQPTTVIGEGHSGFDAELTIDYVGSLENAATVISRWHVGEKRLVFCDSRAKTEQLSALLRDLGVRTFVSHSSLSADERRQAETAFAEEPNCVIVATSTLELGIDVGDLDRVIQIDAPGSVASFLQRMGRTGRRKGTMRNCLFVATDDEGLMIASAIVRLWREGFVEPINPPVTPWHLVAQQAIALILQNRGLARASLEAQLTDIFFDLDANKISQIIGTMLSRSILCEDEGVGGLLGLGETGEDEFGRRHFEAIVSTFSSPLLLTVLHGQRELGFVDPMSIRTRDESAPTLILAGRYWRVVTSDWRSRVVYVEPSENRGKASWLGSSRALRFELCQKMKALLIDRTVPAILSKRAKTRLDNLSDSFAWLEVGKTTVERTVAGNRSEWRWWTFAGGAANFLLAEMMTFAGNKSITHDNLSIRLTCPPKMAEEMALPAELTQQGEKRIGQIGKDLKFSLCLEDDDISSIVKSRLLDWRGAAAIIGQTAVVPWGD
jgi:ATP-dependent Lhr-like helicase